MPAGVLPRAVARCQQIHLDKNSSHQQNLDQSVNDLERVDSYLDNLRSRAWTHVSCQNAHVELLQKQWG